MRVHPPTFQMRSEVTQWSVAEQDSQVVLSTKPLTVTMPGGPGAVIDRPLNSQGDNVRLCSFGWRLSFTSISVSLVLASCWRMFPSGALCLCCTYLPPPCLFTAHRELGLSTCLTPFPSLCYKLTLRPASNPSDSLT